MKKISLLLLSFSILVACNNNKEADKTSETKTTEEKKDTKTGDNDDMDKKETTVTGWPQKDKDDFMSSCVDKAVEGIKDREKATSYCNCMMEKMEMEYPDVSKAATLTDEEIQTVMQKYRDGCIPK